MKKIIYTLVFCCICWSVKAQDVYINGIVKNKNGEKLLGAVVSLEGSSQTVLTNEEGLFRLKVSNLNKPQILKVVYLGYLPISLEINTNNINQTLVLKMEVDPKQLQGVVVSTGYQQISKERATGAYEQIDQKIIDRGVSANIFGRLDGLSPVISFDKRGYNINATENAPNLLVRGLSTINANSAPLIVLDNFPFEGDINSINPNDIASITILKDAVAASIWGARAGNGVIVITTKKGRLDTPLRLNFNSNINITGKPDLMAFPSIASSDYIDTEIDLFAKGFYTSAEQSARKPALSPVVEILIAKRDGNLTAAAADAQIDALRQKDVRRDYLNEVYQQELRQQYALNLNGGSKQHSYYASVGYDKSNQSLRSNSNDRLSLKLENTLQPLKGLELNANIQYSSSNVASLNSNAALGFGQLKSGGRTLYPYASLLNADGSAAIIEKDFRKKYTDAIPVALLNWDYAPLEELRRPGQNINNNALLMDAGIKYTVNKWLKTSLNYRHQEEVFDLRDYRSVDSYFTRNLINLYSQVSGTSLTRNIPLGDILNQTSSKSIADNFRSQLDVNHSWKKHEFSGIAGAEIRQIGTNADSRRTYGYNDDLLTFSDVNYLAVYPAYDNLASANTIPSGTSFEERLYRFVSVYGNAAYTFDSRYAISGSIRKDASNIFGVSTNQKGQPLWSVGALWNLANEDFYKVDWLPYLKLRGSYGVAGNTDNSRSALTTMSYFSSANSLNNLRYGYVVNPPNANLRWEKVSTFNLGVDFSSISNRVSGSIDFYSKRTTDLLGTELVDPLSGFTNNVLNGAAGKGKGFELQLRTENLKGNLGWATNLNIAYNQTKITKYEGNTSTNALVGTGISINPIVDYPVYPLFSYAWAGLDALNGDPKGYVEGQESKDYSTIVSRTPIADLVFHGSAIPLYNGSLLNTFSYKNFELSANISFRLNYYFRRASLSYNDLYAVGEGHAEFTNRWQKPGDEAFTNVPSMIYPAVSARDQFYNYSATTVEPGDHIRLQDIRFSYRLVPISKIKIGFKSMELFAYASNLGILWQASASGLDPDFGFNGIPPSATYSLGFKTSF